MNNYNPELTNTQYKILIVDDDFYIGDIISMILREKGYQVQYADNTVIAERLLEVLPDMILLDLRLGGADGGEFCRRIKGDSRFSRIPVVILSASGDYAKARALECGAEDCLLKPFDIADLEAMVERYTKIN